MKFAENVSKIDSSTRNCIPVNVSKRGLTLVWSPQATLQPQQHLPEEEPEEYSCTPLESVAALLADINAQNMADHPMDAGELAWWLGGVVPKRSTKPIYRAIEAVDANVRQRLRHGNHVHFVYDLVPATTPLTGLRFVLDAGRQPLRGVAEEPFQEAYGLARTLTFKNAEQREVKPSDLWSTLY